MARLSETIGAAEKRYLSRFLDRTLEALFEEDGGYTRNYIRVRAEGAREGERCLVRLENMEKDGARAVIIKEI